MLKKVNKALLISDVTSFSDNFSALAEDIGVTLLVEPSWNVKYRVNADIIIFGSKYISEVNETYYPIAVIILKDGESPAPYIKMGVTRFIFNYKNNYELICALHKSDSVIVHSGSVEYEEIVKNSVTSRYNFGDYDFCFDKNVFMYKGKQIYLSNASKKYLAEWLLHSNKDNAKRMILCNLRKKLGESFLRDVNRYGELKGGKE